ncbi:MAG: lactate utilization protein, partial [Thermotaleaceae bacterium]
RMDAVYFDTVDEAKKYVLSSIDKERCVGIGGSITVQDMNLYEALKEQGNEVIWHWQESTPEGKAAALGKAGKADVYLTSTNALTLTGELFNVDGVGNRVTSMIFGPKKVMILCGINKICRDGIDALDRLRKQAAPPNTKRLNRKTPCAVTGECADCDSPERICNVTTIIHKKPSQMEMEVVIIGENMGY